MTSYHTSSLKATPHNKTTNPSTKNATHDKTSTTLHCFSLNNTELQHNITTIPLTQQSKTPADFHTVLIHTIQQLQRKQTLHQQPNTGQHQGNTTQGSEARNTKTTPFYPNTHKTLLQKPSHNHTTSLFQPQFRLVHKHNTTRQHKEHQHNTTYHYKSLRTTTLRHIFSHTAD